MTNWKSIFRSSSSKSRKSNNSTETKATMAPKIAIFYYSMYGHIAKLAQAEKEGIEAAGGKVDLYQCVLTISSPKYIH